MTDIVERLRASLIDELHDQAEGDDLYSEAAAEIERLRELLRGTGANRYWEVRWRDEIAEVGRLRGNKGGN